LNDPKEILGLAAFGEKTVNLSTDPQAN